VSLYALFIGSTNCKQMIDTQKVIIFRCQFNSIQRKRDRKKEKEKENKHAQTQTTTTEIK